MNTQKLIALAIAASLSACVQRDETKPDTPLFVPRPEQPAQPAGRFKVVRVGIVADSLAYGDKRGIYVITDTKTGQEFVGVSGVGISELGQHRAGKASIIDER